MMATGWRAKHDFLALRAGGFVGRLLPGEAGAQHARCLPGGVPGWLGCLGVELGDDPSDSMETGTVERQEGKLATGGVESSSHGPALLAPRVVQK